MGEDVFLGGELQRAADRREVMHGYRQRAVHVEHPVPDRGQRVHCAARCDHHCHHCGMRLASTPPVSNTAVRVPPALTGNSMLIDLPLRASFHSAFWSVMNIAMASSVFGRQAAIDTGLPSSTVTFTVHCGQRKSPACSTR
ncbi:hypothetical protein G6F22_021065 [Rhizopus arrhizus]|nr:hypothetical protein G6F22_021065 [Rhizopus arrhizus]